MLFKFQWQIEKHCSGLEMGPRLVLMSPLSKIKELHHRRQLIKIPKIPFLYKKIPVKGNIFVEVYKRVLLATTKT